MAMRPSFGGFRPRRGPDSKTSAYPSRGVIQIGRDGNSRVDGIGDDNSVRSIKKVNLLCLKIVTSSCY